MTDFEARCAQTFDRIKNAAADDANHTLTLHMWEACLNLSKPNDVSEAALKLRAKEEGDLLGVMSGDSNAIYNDKGFLDQHVMHRYQRGTQQGAIGLATTPISSKRYMGVFSSQSDTGLLMLDATPVYNDLTDAWSLYYDDANHLPSTEEWSRLHDYAQNGTKDNKYLTSGFAHLRDHPEDRKALVGKIAIMGYPKTNPILVPQVTDIGKPYYLIDPLSSEQQRKAREAYSKVIDAYAKASAEEIGKWRYPEICVNAKLNQVAGIVAMNFRYNPPIDPKQPMSEALANPKAGDFVKTLYRALKEYDQLAEMMRKKGVHQTPTLVVYQPWVKECPMVHLAPTETLKQIVKGEMQKREFLPVTARDIAW